jgi:hypothetical protein
MAVDVYKSVETEVIVFVVQARKKLAAELHMAVCLDWNDLFLHLIKNRIENYI